jgi:hypothetical protein
VHGGLLAVLILFPQQILTWFVAWWQGANGFVQAGGMDASHGLRAAMGRMDKPSLLRLRQECPNGQGGSAGIEHRVWAKDFEGVFGPAFDQGPYFL